MFEKIFQKLYDKNHEIMMMGVWGKDGLELERQYYADLPGVDLELTGAELADIISKLERMKLSPDRYFMKLKLQSRLLLVFSLNSDYFLIVVAQPTIILGKIDFYFNLYRSDMLTSL